MELEHSQMSSSTGVLETIPCILKDNCIIISCSNDADIRFSELIYLVTENSVFTNISSFYYLGPGNHHSILKA
jgi:hypothetical protein